MCSATPRIARCLLARHAVSLGTRVVGKLLEQLRNGKRIKRLGGEILADYCRTRHYVFVGRFVLQKYNVARVLTSSIATVQCHELPTLQPRNSTRLAAPRMECLVLGQSAAHDAKDRSLAPVGNLRMLCKKLCRF